MIKNFNINTTLRVLFLFLLLFGLVWWVQRGDFGIALLAGGMTIIALVQLIRYVQRANREVANFFSAVKYNDFTLHTALAGKGGSFDALQESLRMVNQKFLNIRAEKEANHQFLQTLVRHIEIGMLCVKEDGEVILMNEALRKLLHKSYLVNFDGLKKIDKNLWEKTGRLRPGDAELVKLNIENTLLQLSVKVADIKLQDETFRLFTFQNIQNELESKELDAWQKLIRILTHEIMNSVAPISSLSATIQDMLENERLTGEEKLENIRRSIGVIYKRSEGLLDFTETYRKLTRIPPPKFQRLNAIDLVEEVVTLLEPKVKETGVRLEKKWSVEHMPFQGDPHLLEQVLINLVKNAMDAAEAVDDGWVSVAVFPQNNGKLCIQVADNGPGIPEELMEQIFVPFFTTKEKGSGIGLSLSRQIIRMHKGQIELKSAVGEGTVVSIMI